jgi:hypothetical protein
MSITRTNKGAPAEAAGTEASMVCLAHFFKSVPTISAAAATMLLSPVTAQTGTLELEILSKDDAGAIFAMTRAEWTESVRRAVMGGAARATGSPGPG